MQHTKTKFSGAAYYQRAIWLARWFNIAIVLGTYPLDQPHTIYLLMLLALSVALNLGSYLIRRRNKEPLLGSFASVTIDNMFVLSLLLLTGGLTSPYFLFILIIPLISAYWYGVVGVASLLFIDLTIAIFITNLFPQATTITAFRALLVEVLTVINIGLLAERLTRAQRLDRTVTEEINEQIEAEREQLLALVNSMADAVVATDQQGLIRLYNGAALDLLDSNLDLKGKSLKEMLPVKDEAGKMVDLLGQAMRTPGTIHRRDLVYKSGNETINLYVSIAPVRPLHGEGQEGYIMTIRDITKEKSLEEQRDEFISVASHELRTPLAIAEANLSTALLPHYAKIDPKAKELVEQAHQNLVFLGDLIRDLTTIAKIEQGGLEVEMAMVDPAKLIERLERDYRPEIEAKHLELKVHLAKGLPQLATSEGRVHEILQNFLTNAIKYTQKGSITIEAHPLVGKQTGVLFSVADTGIGVSVSDQKKLFGKFYRSEDYRTRATGGTGLGLYISLKLAERLGARLWFDSQLDKGSTFYLELHNSRLSTPSK